MVIWVVHFSKHPQYCFFINLSGWPKFSYSVPLARHSLHCLLVWMRTLSSLYLLTYLRWWLKNVIVQSEKECKVKQSRVGGMGVVTQNIIMYVLWGVIDQRRGVQAFFPPQRPQPSQVCKSFSWIPIMEFLGAMQPGHKQHEQTVPKGSITGVSSTSRLSLIPPADISPGQPSQECKIFNWAR